MKEAENLIYRSYLRAIGNINETADAKVKNIDLTRQLFELLNSPDSEQKFILVTGSKGKGSTSRFISSLLTHLGFKVGLFTSPHLVHFNERIRINGKAISDQDFIRLSNKVLKPFNTIETQLSSDEYQGPIGVSLAIATLYFKEKNTDINVIECGRGGEFDDTNILRNEWAVITPIMTEHLPQLGPTIDDIISHKLGIIKPTTKSVYVSEQYENLPNVKMKMSTKEISQISYYGMNFVAKNISLHSGGTIFDVETEYNLYPQLNLPLLGSFQAVNIATAIKVCEDIIRKKLNYSTLKQCFASIQWPGRCEIIDHHPTIILDGAINEKSAKFVQEVLEKIGGKQIVSIIGVPTDKDYRGVIKVLSEFSNKLIITKPDISHLAFPDDAINYAQSLLSNSVETNVLAEAVALTKQEPNVDIILIVGTQTLIANAKRLWNHSLMDLG